MPQPQFNTIEEAQAEILRLNEEVTRVTNERDSYSARVTEQSAELEKVRELNQQYFLKLSAQYAPPTKPEEDEPDTPTCEEFAATLNI